MDNYQKTYSVTVTITDEQIGKEISEFTECVDLDFDINVSGNFDFEFISCNPETSDHTFSELRKKRKEICENEHVLLGLKPEYSEQYL